MFSIFKVRAKDKSIEDGYEDNIFYNILENKFTKSIRIPDTKSLSHNYFKDLLIKTYDESIDEIEGLCDKP